MARTQLFVFLLLCIACGVVHCQVCPNPVDIDPCTCKKYPEPSVTTCSNITSMDTLYEMFGKSFDIPILSFVLRYSNVQYLPATSVTGKKFRIIQYEDSAMTALFDAQPDPTEHLKEFRVYRTRLLRGVQWKFFSSFTNLSRIEVDSTEVKKIGKDFKNNINNKIERLRFVDTKTVLLEDDVFDQLTEATDIKFVAGKITELKRSMFPQTNKIRYLNFNANRIKTIPSDLFTNMPELRGVELAYNQLTGLPKEVYGDWLKNDGNYLDVIENPLVCDCRMRWITNGILSLRSTRGNCAEPLSMKGKWISLLKPEDFHFCNEAYQSD